MKNYYLPNQKRHNIKDRDVNKVKVDSRPLDQREHPLNTRKGMVKVSLDKLNIGFFDKTEYTQSEITLNKS